MCVCVCVCDVIVATVLEALRDVHLSFFSEEINITRDALSAITILTQGHNIGVITASNPTDHAAGCCINYTWKSGIITTFKTRYTPRMEIRMNATLGLIIDIHCSLLINRSFSVQNASHRCYVYCDHSGLVVG